MKAQELIDRGFIPKGLSGEYILSQDKTTIIVILGRYEQIEIYTDGCLQEAHPIDHVRHVDEICYIHGFKYKIPSNE